MTEQAFVTLEEKHIGKKVFRAFGKRWRLQTRIRRQDVGRRVYRIAQDQIEIEACPRVMHECPSAFIDALDPQSMPVDFITVQPQHVGHSIVSACASHWDVGRTIRPSDVGKRLYLDDARSVEVDPGVGTPAEPDKHPHILELCGRLGVEFTSEICDDTYALWDAQFDGAITPWFETVDELEEFCTENLDRYLHQTGVA
jgi:hypothetical protein